MAKWQCYDSWYQRKIDERTTKPSKRVYKKRDEPAFLQAQIRLMGINRQRNPRTNLSIHCSTFPLWYPSFNFNLATLRGRWQVIPNTSVIYSPHFRRWYDLPLISKLGIVFNLNNNNNNNKDGRFSRQLKHWNWTAWRKTSWGWAAVYMKHNR